MKRLALILALLCVTARADLVRVPFEGVRPTGMGNAFIAVADDANALWYNPAGLAKIKGVHGNLFDITLGTDSTDSINRLKDALFHGQYPSLIRPTQEFLRAGLKPALFTPYFGISVFDNAQSYTNLDLSSADGHVDVYTFNDIGVIAGIGLPASDSVSFGISVRFVERTAMDAHLTYQDLLRIAATSSANFESGIYDYLKSLMGTGWGIGLNAGTIIRVPLPKGGPRWQFGATVEDAGQTTFRQIGSLPLPPPIRPSYNLGTALQYDLPGKAVLNVALDARNLFEPIPVVQQVHFGLEYRHPLFGIRTGLYQGYPCFGFSIETPPHTRIHFSTFAEEQGHAAYQKSQRWYLLQLEIGFNPL